MLKHSTVNGEGNQVVDINRRFNATRFTTLSPTRLSKRFFIEGGSLCKESGGNMIKGIAELLTLSWAEFAAMLPRLTPKQAMAYGVSQHQYATVITADALARHTSDNNQPTIARTRTHFAWPDGHGILMLDYDPAPTSALSPDELKAALIAVCPALAEAPTIWRPSASSCIYSTDGKELRGINGQRLYVGVQDAADIPRAGQVLFDRLWLADHGRYDVSISGMLLPRTLIDGSVFQPERLDFCGGAECGKGLEQRLPAPVVSNEDGAYLDTRAALPALTAAELDTLECIRNELKAARKDAQAAVRSTWITQRVDERLAKLPEENREPSRPQLEKVYREAAEIGRLDLDFEITVVAKGSKTRKVLTVGELFAPLHRGKYHEATTLDPLEPEYNGGRLVGWLNLHTNAPYLQSHAHGGIRYLLGAKPKFGALPAISGVTPVTAISGGGVAVTPVVDPGVTGSPIPMLNQGLITNDALSVSKFDEKLIYWDKYGAHRIVVSLAATEVAMWLTGKIAWAQDGSTWLLWCGTHWQADAQSLAEKLIADSIAEGTGSVGFTPIYFDGIVKIIQKRDLLPMPNVKKGMVPFQNGLLDIATGELIPATPQNALYWVLPHEYSPTADCPTIKDWLLKTVDGDNNTVELLRAWMSALVRGIELQKILLLLGPGGTGKGVFQRLVVGLIGVMNVAVTNLRDIEENRFEAAKLYGRRLAMINEAGRHGGAINVLKAITGGDHIPIERKHIQQSGSFVFHGLVLMVSNDQLQTTDRTSGIERRRVTVEFNRRATPREKMEWEKLGGEEQVLHTEIPGLINWLMELSVDDIRSKFEELPNRVKMSNLLGLAAGNSVADWMIENCAPEPDAWCQVGEKKECRDREDGHIYYEHAKDWLYPHYLTWFRQTGRDKPVSLRTFGNVIEDIGEKLGYPSAKKRQPGTGKAIIQGLRLLHPNENIFPWVSHGCEGSGSGVRTCEGTVRQFFAHVLDDEKFYSQVPQQIPQHIDYIDEDDNDSGEDRA